MSCACSKNLPWVLVNCMTRFDFAFRDLFTILVQRKRKRCETSYYNLVFDTCNKVKKNRVCCSLN